MTTEAELTALEHRLLAEMTAEKTWHDLIEEQGWNDDTQIGLLEDFVRERALFNQLADFAVERAKAENEQGEDDGLDASTA